MHLRTSARDTQSPKIIYMTYVLDGAEPVQQKQCDDLLFAGLARLGRGAEQAVQFGMDTVCKSGESLSVQQPGAG